jgi:hypothetical protein
MNKDDLSKLKEETKENARATEQLKKDVESDRMLSRINDKIKLGKRKTEQDLELIKDQIGLLTKVVTNTKSDSKSPMFEFFGQQVPSHLPATAGHHFGMTPLWAMPPSHFMSAQNPYTQQMIPPQISQFSH